MITKSGKDAALINRSRFRICNCLACIIKLKLKLIDGIGVLTLHNVSIYSHNSWYDARYVCVWKVTNFKDIKIFVKCLCLKFYAPKTIKKGAKWIKHKRM